MSQSFASKIAAPCLNSRLLNSVALSPGEEENSYFYYKFVKNFIMDTLIGLLVKST